MCIIVCKLDLCDITNTDTPLNGSLSSSAISLYIFTDIISTLYLQSFKMKFLISAANLLLIANTISATPLTARKQAAIENLRAKRSARVQPRPNQLIGSADINGTAAVESGNVCIFLEPCLYFHNQIRETSSIPAELEFSAGI